MSLNYVMLLINYIAQYETPGSNFKTCLNFVQNCVGSSGLCGLSCDVSANFKGT